MKSCILGYAQTMMVTLEVVRRLTGYYKGNIMFSHKDMTQEEWDQFLAVNTNRLIMEEYASLPLNEALEAITEDQRFIFQLEKTRLELDTKKESCGSSDYSEPDSGWRTRKVFGWESIA